MRKIDWKNSANGLKNKKMKTITISIIIRAIQMIMIMIIDNNNNNYFIISYARSLFTHILWPFRFAESFNHVLDPELEENDNWCYEW